MKVLSKLLILFFGLLLAAAVFYPNSAKASDCAAPLPGMVNYTVSPSGCSFNTSESGGVNGVDGGNLTIPSNTTLTLQPGQTIVFNPGNQVIVSPTGKIDGPPNQIKKTKLWMIDANKNGYPASMAQFASDSLGLPYVRRKDISVSNGVNNGFYRPAYSSLKTVVDCNEATDPSVRVYCPSATTGSYTNNATSSYSDTGNANNVTLNGSGYTGGKPNEVWFQYWKSGEAPSACSDKGGSATAHHYFVDPFGVPITSGLQTRSETLSGLDFGTVYKYCYISLNTYGIAFGDINTFTTPPYMYTNVGQSVINPTSATLVGNVTAGNISTDAWFEWGLAGAESGVCRWPSGAMYYPNSTSPHTSVSPGSAVSFSANISGLTSGTNYAYCALGSNGSLKSSGGSALNAYGSGMHFTTPYNMSVSVSGPGSVTSDPAGINCAPTCSANYSPNTRITLTAHPSPDKILQSWGGGTCSGSSNTCAFYINEDKNGSKTITATFVCAPHNLTVQNGTGNASGCTGTAHAISANSATYPTVFTGWSQNPSNGSFANSGALNTNYTLGTVDETVTANYYTYSWHYCVPEQWPIPNPEPPPNGNYCNFNGWMDIESSNGKWGTMHNYNGAWCNINVFGDPDPGVSKACYKWY